MRLVWGVVIFVFGMFVLTIGYFMMMPVQKTIYKEVNSTAQGMDLSQSTKTEVSKTLGFFIFQLRVIIALIALGLIAWVWMNSQKVDYESARL